MTNYMMPWSEAQHADYNDRMDRLVSRVMSGEASVGEELNLAYMMNNPPPPQYIDCDMCKAKDVPYERAWPLEHYGLICGGCNARLEEAERRRAAAPRVVVVPHQDERRQLGRCIKSLLENPTCPDSKAIRKQVKDIRKKIGWKPCKWCSICTRPLVKDNSEVDAKVCKACDPVGVKGKPTPSTRPVHSDRRVFDLAARGFGSAKK